ncbi:MAG: flagellar type III secretion system pore protein FliP [Proteobacteria bacterium]|nr:flagellar type III secretion system pore protein FliP [Pseudomonadota bacterium]MBU4297253.1 flagellar type III secretion system pore protein FliP [Pseudomonadota bacterium]MCG2747704.1 flagellar type III secretion system pore protein FliP [Desulfobulbaceae bacterium]
MKKFLLLLTPLLLLLMVTVDCQAVMLPTVQIGMADTNDPKQVSVLIEILLIFTVLSIAPAIILMTTCFTRLVVAFSFLRNALGTQQMPPAQLLIGLSLFLTIFIMTPVLKEMNETAVTPYMNQQIDLQQAFTQGIKPLRAFMFKQTREKDLALFLGIAKMQKPANKDDVPTTILVPSFVISELKTAFQIGFILFLPFLVIDMVVASVLLSMGMMMLPPVMVSLPFKLLLFVLVDGWYLIVGSLVKSFGV